MPAAVTINAKPNDPDVGGESFGYGPGRIVPVYATTGASYAVGDGVMYPAGITGRLYHAKVAVPAPAGAFTAAKWTKVN